MTRTAVANEPFTAADGTNVESLTDSTARWAGVDFSSGFATVTSNKCNLAFSTGGGILVFRETATYTNDQYAFATMGGVANGVSFVLGTVVRAAGSAGTSTYYEWVTDNTSVGNSPFTTILRSVVNRTPATLDTRTVAWAPGDVMLLEVIGTTLNCYRNGSLVFNLTDSTISTGTPGYSISGINSHSHTWDDWEGGNVTADVADTLMGQACL